MKMRVCADGNGTGWLFLLYGDLTI